jgi:hypothetical protein
MRLDCTRRLLAAGAIVGAAALAVAGCSGSGTDVQAKGATPGQAAPPATTNGPGNGQGSVNGQANANGNGQANGGGGQANGATKSVRYRGLEFSVPTEWPVYDLEADPTTCVRFDVNAVYLGHPGQDMQCPAVVVGHADSVLVEPAAGSAIAAQAREAHQINGLDVDTDPGAEAESQVHAKFPGQGVAVTIAFLAQQQAYQILGSFHEAGR